MKFFQRFKKNPETVNELIWHAGHLTMILVLLLAAGHFSIQATQSLADWKFEQDHQGEGQ